MGKCGLAVHLPVIAPQMPRWGYPPNIHHGDWRWGPLVTGTFSTFRPLKTMFFKKEHGVHPLQEPQGNQREHLFGRRQRRDSRQRLLPTQRAGPPEGNATPGGMDADNCGNTSSTCASNESTPKLTQGRPSLPKCTFWYPCFPPLGDPARLNLAHTRET